MRFRILVLALFLLVSGSVSAQITLGGRLGYGFSASSFELNKGMTRNIGYSPLIGAIIHYNLDLKFSAGAEINYYKFSESINFNEDLFPDRADAVPQAIDMKTSLSYIQVPFMGRASIGDKKYRAFISIGPYIGFAVGGTWSNAPKVRYFQNQVNQSIPDYPTLDTTYNLNQGKMRKIDLGGVISGGIEYQLGTTDWIFAEGRIQLGFLDNYRMESDTRRAFTNSNYLFPSATWRAFNFSVGYIRNFKLPKFQTSDKSSKRAGKQKRG
jgi:hypothetical protein